MMPKGNCEFKGTGRQYFITVLVHLFLFSLITFGIYSAWAWVRLRRLKVSHTIINGKHVTFSGTGQQLFVLVLINFFLTVITLGIYGPWAICKFLDWKASNTLVEGEPSQFTGTGGSFFLFCLIHLMILPVLTLGIYYLWGLYRFYAWEEEHTKYGGERTSFGAGFGEFLKVILIGCILNPLTLNLFMPWFVCMLYGWKIHGLAVGDGKVVQHFPPVKANRVVVAVFIIVALLLPLALGLYIKNRIESHLTELMSSERPVPKKITPREMPVVTTPSPEEKFEQKFVERPLSYSYNPKGKQDPFKPFMDIRKSDKKLGKSAPGSPPGESVPRSPLQKISIDQLRLVGIVCGDKKKVAIVEDTKGEHHHYILHKGTHIGMNAGRVVKILPDRVIIEEKSKSPSGKIKEKQVVLKLRTEENGGRP